MLPVEIADAIRERLGDQKDSTLRTIGAAVSILKHFLGEEFLKQRIRLSETPDPFMLNEFDEESDNRLLHVHRVCQLAEMILGLSKQAGFDILCDRLKRKPMEPVYADTEVASILKDHEFDIEIIDETGKRGKDFDMRATKNGQHLNVEVTSSTAVNFRPGTLLNILHQKRSQVPQGQPAGLFINFPLSWFGGQDDLQSHLVETTKRFFGGSTRFNFVVFVWHPIEKRDELYHHATLTYPVINERAAHAYPHLDWLTRGKTPSAEHEKALQSGQATDVNPELNFQYMIDFNALAAQSS